MIDFIISEEILPPNTTLEDLEADSPGLFTQYFEQQCGDCTDCGCGTLACAEDKKGPQCTDPPPDEGGDDHGCGLQPAICLDETLCDYNNDGELQEDQFCACNSGQYHPDYALYENFDQYWYDGENAYNLESKMATNSIE